MRKAFALTLLAVAACYGNIVQNPGFETGDFTDWYGGGWGTYTMAAHSGSWSAGTACVGSPLSCYLSQDLATVAGSSYDFSVFVQENGGPPSEFEVEWGGTTVLDVVNPANNTWPNTWVQLNISGLVATSNITTLTIRGRQDPAVIFMDDISVDPAVGGVPEPATVGISAAGLIALALRRRR